MSPAVEIHLRQNLSLRGFRRIAAAAALCCGLTSAPGLAQESDAAAADCAAPDGTEDAAAWFRSEAERLEPTAAADAIAAYECAAQLDPSDAESLIFVGQLHAELGDLDAAEEATNRALAAAGDADPLTTARALNNLGSFAGMRGDDARSRELIAQALAVVEEHGEPADVAIVLVNQGVGALNRQDFAEAERLMLRARAIYAEESDVDGQGRVLNYLGVVAAQAGNLEGAEAYLIEARDLGAANANVPLQLTSLNNLGRLATMGGNYAKGCRYADETIALASSSGDEETVQAVNAWKEASGCSLFGDAPP